MAHIDGDVIDKTVVKINDTLYASKYEVSNKLYGSYVDFLRESKRGKEFDVSRIDSVQWGSVGKPFVEYYHRHPAYQDYPVVNVIHEAAKSFCAWLTSQYNSNANRKFKKVVFRLPTEQEWVMAAKGGTPSALYAWEGNELKNKKGALRCNYKAQDHDAAAGDNVDITSPVESYWPNEYGIYNMSGNVAEMVSQKGVVKGGDWMHGKEQLEVNAKLQYDGTAKPFVGFRYVMVVIEQ